MKQKCIYGIVLLVTLLLPLSCIEPYVPPGIDNNTEFLVVDAFINSTDGSATVQLTHTLAISSTDTADNKVNGASVRLESDDHQSMALTFEHSGLYTAKDLSISPSHKYRLMITTPNEKSYESDFVPVLSTPPIDSVTWNLDNGFLNILANTHDDTGNSRYYRWKAIETWEYVSKFLSTITVRNDTVKVRPLDQRINHCWRTVPLSKINIYSSDYLAHDVVSNFVLQSIPPNSLKLTTRYSILVQQQVLSKEAYSYWLNVKKTTESLGSLFDPLPGAVTGNIHCTSNPAEQTIGYFSIGTVSETRIYITRAQLLSFVTYQYPYCQVDTISNEQVPFVDDPSRFIEAAYDENGVQIGWLITDPLCTDCRLLGGGVTVKPPYWPN